MGLGERSTLCAGIAGDHACAHGSNVRGASSKHTLAARELKVQGLIAYSRGHIEVKKPEALHRLAFG